MQFQFVISWKSNGTTLTRCSGFQKGYLTPSDEDFNITSRSRGFSPSACAQYDHYYRFLPLGGLGRLSDIFKTVLLNSADQGPG